MSKQWFDGGLQKEEMTDVFRRWKQAIADLARILETETYRKGKRFESKG
jgi:hypothetical protein